jgi:hypothetical protein
MSRHGAVGLALALTAGFALTVAVSGCAVSGVTSSSGVMPRIGAASAGDQSTWHSPTNQGGHKTVTRAPTFDGYNKSATWRLCSKATYAAGSGIGLDGELRATDFEQLSLSLPGTAPIDLSLTIPGSTNGSDYNTSVTCFLAGGPYSPAIVSVEFGGE